MTREKLPRERSALAHRFAMGEGSERIRLYLHAGMYPDGRLGEIFLTVDKQGSLLSALFDTVAVLTSVALQHGVPLSVIVEKFKNTRFEPMTVVDGAQEIPRALSILDYLGRFLELRFPNGYATAEVAELTAGERYDTSMAGGFEQCHALAPDKGGFCVLPKPHEGKHASADGQEWL